MCIDEVLIQVTVLVSDNIKSMIINCPNYNNIMKYP